MNKMEKRALLADGALLLVAAIWGGSYVAAKAALYEMAPLTVLAIRTFGAGLLLALIFYKKMGALTKATLKCGILLGMVLVLGQAVLMIGLQYTDAGKQAFLIAAYTLFVPFVAWAVLRKRPQLTAILASVVIVAGIALLTLQSDFTIGYGDSLSLAASLLFALHIVLISACSQRYDPLLLTIIQLLTAGILVGAVALLVEPRPVWGELSSTLWLSLGYLLFINTALAFPIQNIAQSHTTAARSSIILSLESVFSMVLSILILHEVLTGRMVVGCVLIFAAVLISKLERHV